MEPTLKIEVKTSVSESYFSVSLRASIVLAEVNQNGVVLDVNSYDWRTEDLVKRALNNALVQYSSTLTGSIRKKSDNDDHVSNGTTVNNFGYIYGDLDKVGDLEALVKILHKIKKSIFDYTAEYGEPGFKENLLVAIKALGIKQGYIETVEENEIDSNLSRKYTGDTTASKGAILDGLKAYDSAVSDIQYRFRQWKRNQ